MIANARSDRSTPLPITPIADVDWAMILPRIGALDIAEAVAERIGSYADMNFVQFLAVEADRVQCWYMNDAGKGPSFEIELHRTGAGWRMNLTEHPAGTDQQIEVP